MYIPKMNEEEYINFVAFCYARSIINDDKGAMSLVYIVRKLLGKKTKGFYPVVNGVKNDFLNTIAEWFHILKQKCTTLEFPLDENAQNMITIIDKILKLTSEFIEEKDPSSSVATYIGALALLLLAIDNLKEKFCLEELRKDGWLTIDKEKIIAYYEFLRTKIEYTLPQKMLERKPIRV